MRQLQDFSGELLCIIASNLERNELRYFRAQCRSLCVAAWPHFKKLFTYQDLIFDSVGVQRLLELSQHEHLAKQVLVLQVSLEDYIDDEQTKLDFRNAVFVFNTARILKAFVNLQRIVTRFSKEHYFNDHWQDVLSEVPQYSHNSSETVIAEACFDTLMWALRMSQRNIATLDMGDAWRGAIGIPSRVLEKYGLPKEVCTPAISLKYLGLAVDPKDTCSSFMADDTLSEAQVLRYTDFFQNFLPSESLTLQIEVPTSLQAADAEADLVRAVFNIGRFRRLELGTNSFPLPISSLMSFLKAQEGVLEILQIK